jgi:uncharacterized protein YegP (UPF0339 family)
MAKRPFPSFFIFRDKQGHWRWNFAGPGGRILAAGSQAYTRSAGCVRVIRLLKGSANIPVVGSEEDIKAARESVTAAAAAGAAKAKPAPKKGADQTAKKAE